jgi:hypothetical protein
MIPQSGVWFSEAGPDASLRREAKRGDFDGRATAGPLFGYLPEIEAPLREAWNAASCAVFVRIWAGHCDFSSPSSF